MYQHLPIKNLPYMNISWKRNTTAHHPAVLQKSDRSPPPPLLPAVLTSYSAWWGLPARAGYPRHTPPWQGWLPQAHSNFRRRCCCWVILHFPFQTGFRNKQITGLVSDYSRNIINTIQNQRGIFRQKWGRYKTYWFHKIWKKNVISSCSIYDEWPILLTKIFNGKNVSYQWFWRPIKIALVQGPTLNILCQFGEQCHCGGALT